MVLEVQGSLRCDAGLTSRQKEWKNKAKELGHSAAPLSLALNAAQRKFRRPSYLLVHSVRAVEKKMYTTVISQSTVKHKCIGKQSPSVLCQWKRSFLLKKNTCSSCYSYCKPNDMPRAWTQQCQQSLSSRWLIWQCSRLAFPLENTEN